MNFRIISIVTVLIFAWDVVDGSSFDEARKGLGISKEETGLYLDGEEWGDVDDDDFWSMEADFPIIGSINSNDDASATRFFKNAPVTGREDYLKNIINVDDVQLHSAYIMHGQTHGIDLWFDRHSFCSHLFMIETCITRRSKLAPLRASFGASTENITVVDLHPLTDEKVDVHGFSISCIYIKPDLLFAKFDSPDGCLFTTEFWIEIRNDGADDAFQIMTNTKQTFVHTLPYRNVLHEPSLHILPPNLCNSGCLLEVAGSQRNLTPIVSENGIRRYGTLPTKLKIEAYVVDLPEHDQMKYPDFSISSPSPMSNPFFTINLRNWPPQKESDYKPSNDAFSSSHDDSSSSNDFNSIYYDPSQDSGSSNEASFSNDFNSIYYDPSQDSSSSNEASLSNDFNSIYYDPSQDSGSSKIPVYP